MRKRFLLIAFVLVACSSAGIAQNNPKLSTMIPNLFGPTGITLAPPAAGFSHSAHFSNQTTGAGAQLNQFNSSLTQQLASLPLPSPASGFTYSLDTGMGTLTRSAQSFGPVLTERAETIGRHRLTVGFSYQHFGFDSLQGIDLGNVPLALTHQDIPNQQFDFEDDLIMTNSKIDLSVNEVTTFVTFGLTDRLDVSLAVPIVRTDLKTSTTATIQRIGTANSPLTHRFLVDGVAQDSLTTSQSASASGIGDMILRVKGTVMKWEHAGLAFAADLRMPTGDEENLLGTGAVGFKPFAVLSFPLGRISPHVNVGYQFNGDSTLAGDPLTGTKGNLPDQFVYAAGVDIGVNPRVTAAFDLLGQRVIDAQVAAYSTVTSRTTTDPSLSFFANRSFSQNSAAASVKFNPIRQLLVDFSVIFRLDNGGLRDDVTPMFGASYNF